MKGERAREGGRARAGSRREREQKEILFHKLRQEQLRRWRLWDAEMAAALRPRVPRVRRVQASMPAR